MKQILFLVLLAAISAAKIKSLVKDGENVKCKTYCFLKEDTCKENREEYGKAIKGWNYKKYKCREKKWQVDKDMWKEKEWSEYCFDAFYWKEKKDDPDKDPSIMLNCFVKRGEMHLDYKELGKFK